MGESPVNGGLFDGGLFMQIKGYMAMLTNIIYCTVSHSGAMGKKKLFMKSIY